MKTTLEDKSQTGCQTTAIRSQRASLGLIPAARYLAGVAAAA